MKYLKRSLSKRRISKSLGLIELKILAEDITPLNFPVLVRSSTMKRKLCLSDADFQRSISFQREFEVWVGDEFDKVGRVESYTEGTVIVDGDKYLRVN